MWWSVHHRGQCTADDGDGGGQCNADDGGGC
jgi:hypothetical protein